RRNISILIFSIRCGSLFSSCPIKSIKRWRPEDAAEELSNAHVGDRAELSGTTRRDEGEIRKGEGRRSGTGLRFCAESLGKARDRPSIFPAPQWTGRAIAVPLPQDSDRRRENV